MTETMTMIQDEIPGPALLSAEDVADDATMAEDEEEFLGEVAKRRSRRKQHDRTIPAGEGAPASWTSSSLLEILDGISPGGAGFAVWMERLAVMYSEREAWMAQKAATDPNMKVMYRCEECGEAVEGISPQGRTMLPEDDLRRVIKCPNIGIPGKHKNRGLTPMTQIEL